MDWQFQKPTYNLPPQGNYRARISNAIWDVSKSSGRPMSTITLSISGHKETVKYWIASDISAQIFCRCFNLDPYDINSQQPDKINRWIGAEGGVNIVHEELQNGVIRANAKCLTPKQTSYLAPFVPPQQQPQQQTQQPQPQQPPAQFANWEQQGFNQPQQPPQPRHDFTPDTARLSNPDIPF